MDKKDKRIDLLTARVTQLEHILAMLADKQKNDVHFLAGLDDTEVKLRKIMERNIEDLFARLKRVEFWLFPKLRSDLIRLWDIIGDDTGEAYDPRDIRKSKD